VVGDGDKCDAVVVVVHPANNKMLLLLCSLPVCHQLQFGEMWAMTMMFFNKLMLLLCVLLTGHCCGRCNRGEEAANDNQNF